MDTEASYSASFRINCRNKIVQRLIQVGVPAELLRELQQGLIVFSREKKYLIPELVRSILPTDEDAKDVINKSIVGGLRGWLRESMTWLQWMMFEGDPKEALKILAKKSEGQRGVCGTSWGPNELAYCCKTCEHDPSCAICFPCFQNGNHEGHEYTIINTGNGCCDCGDATAWKPEGFCSRHKGVVQIQPLQEEYSASMGIALDAVLVCCQNKLLHLEAIYYENPTGDNLFHLRTKSTSKLLAAVAGMLLEFCRQSESLLCLICKKMLTIAGLLDTLVRAERYVSENAVKILRDMLLKLLGEPEFKYEFAKAFVNHYPRHVESAIKELGDASMKNLSIVPSFSVQLFTVPSLTLRLVKESNLLAMLLGCLEDIFSSCGGDDGCVMVSKLERFYEITLHTVHDIGYVMSIDEVPRYMITEQHDLLKKWIKLLSFLQGMDALKRKTGLHVVQENENAHMPFVLCHYLEEIHSCLVSGVFLSWQMQETSDMPILNSDSNVGIERDNCKHATVRQASQENLLSITAERASFVASSPTFSLSDYNSTYQFANTGLIVCLIGMCLKEIMKKLNAGRALEETQSLKVEKWQDVDYDVSSQEISVHIPLHRLLALLLQKALAKHFGAPGETSGISSCSSGPCPSLAANHEIFDHLLSGCSAYGFSSFVMEQPLRVRVFCAQVYAGMWRKNGYAAFYACDLYGNLQWSVQCLELDLFTLQCCAVLAPADSFVHRIIQRFGLSNYLSLDAKQTNEYEPTLVKEMLNLLIQIVTERRFCGFNTVEGLKRELIRRLAIGDATHSQLLKSLPPDLKSSKHFSNILDEISVYSNPFGFNQGKYSLKIKYWKELDLYHPRWRPKDLEVAEERYLHFCGTSAVSTQLPRWSKIYPPLNGISRVATCKVALQLTRAVIYYACATDDQTLSRAPSGVLLTALHLLSLALDICFVMRGSKTTQNDDDPILLIAFAYEKIDRVETDVAEGHSLLSLLVLLMRKSGNENLSNLMDVGSRDLYVLTKSLLKSFAELDTSCMNYLKVCAPEVVGSLPFSGSNSSTSTDSLKLNNDKLKEKARLRQAAILAKMKAEQSKFLESVNTEARYESDESGGPKEEGGEDFVDGTVEHELVCSLCHARSRSPLSIPVLLQKSKLGRFVDKGLPSCELVQAPDETREILDRIQNHIRNSTGTNMSSEMLEFHDFTIDTTSESSDTYQYMGDMDPSGTDNEGSCQSGKTSMAKFHSLESLEADLYSSVWKYVHDHMNDAPNSLNVFESLKNFDANLSYSKRSLAGTSSNRMKKHSEATITKSLDNDTVPGSNSQFGYGGLAPADCDGIFLSSCGHAIHQNCLDRYLSSLRKRKFASEGKSIVDPDKGEFLCPLCRLLANSALPRSSPRRKKQRIIDASGSFPTIGHSETPQHKLFRIWHAMVLLQTTTLMVSDIQTREDFPDRQNERLESNSSSFLFALENMYLGKNAGDSLAEASGSQSTIMWDAVMYSLIATEIGARSSSTSLSPSYGLGSLCVGERSVSKDLLSVFLEAAETIRTENRADVLLRLKGIQLFANSVCLAHSRKESPRSASEQPGNLDRSLNKIPNHDAAFLELASEPVLSRDSFSSLMWILFCLPSPFLACRQTFISLVHIFYIVSVTQAIIAYCAESKLNRLEIGSQGGMLKDMIKAMCDDKVAHHFFRSNYVDPSSGIYTFIHRVTFPYLRRCALLSRVLGIPFVETNIDSQIHDKVNTLSDAMAEEYSEIQLLHNKFGVPTLDDVMNEEVLRCLAIKWYNHWANWSVKDKHQNVLYSTPAVPFRLMHLPNIFQDLLQRYINENCRECGSVPKEPALCLICGKICSPFWNPCCRRGGCKLHAMACGAGTGMFLLIRKTTVVLRSGIRETLWHSPYLDAYGEEIGSDHPVSLGSLWLYCNSISPLFNHRYRMLDCKEEGPYFLMRSGTRCFVTWWQHMALTVIQRCFIKLLRLSDELSNDLMEATVGHQVLYLCSSTTAVDLDTLDIPGLMTADALTNGVLD